MHWWRPAMAICAAVGTRARVPASVDLVRAGNADQSGNGFIPTRSV
jgi:hypothetical protein